MPKVPRLDSPQVQQQGYQPVLRNTRPPDDFGLKEQQQKVAGLAMGIVQKAREDADQVAVLNADKELSALETDILYNPETGAYNKKGKDAFGLPETVSEDWKKGADKIAESLSNPVQRAAFQRSVNSRYGDIDRQLQKHVGVEMSKYDDETTSAYIANERSAAVMNYQDPERVEMAKQRQQAAIMDHAKRNGLPEEWAKQKIQDTTSKTNTDIVNRMLANGDDLNAKKYFDANKEQFQGDDIAAVEKNLEEGSLRGESQRQSDEIVRKYGGSLTAAMEQVKKIQDPKIRDATQERVKSEFALKEVADRERRQKMQTQATNILDQTGNIDQIPPAMWNQFELSERAALKAYAKAKAAGTEVPTSWQDYYDLRRMAEAPALRDKFKSMNLMEYRGKLADTEFKQIADLQAGLLKGDDKTLKELDGFRTDSQIVEDAWRQIGMSTSKDAEAYATFRRKVDEVVQSEQARTGKKLGNNEIQAVVDNLTVQGVTEKGIFWDSTKRVYELEDNESIEITINDVPKTERSRIEAALRRRGLPVNDRTVIGLYGEKIQRQRGASNGG